jgi:hypothetical protein
MAHPEQMHWFASIQQRWPYYFNQQRVLEVGSLNLNGTVRIFFTDCDYTGIDLGPGPGVDLIANGAEYCCADHYSVVISTESFEHNPDWVKTFDNMLASVCTTGLIIFTCASTGRPEHGTRATTPSDSPYTCDNEYYRNLTEQDFRQHWDFDQLFSEYAFYYNADSCDLYFAGIRRK